MCRVKPCQIVVVVIFVGIIVFVIVVINVDLFVVRILVLLTLNPQRIYPPNRDVMNSSSTLLPKPLNANANASHGRAGLLTRKHKDARA